MVLIFALIRFIPGDPADVMLGARATEESRAMLQAGKYHIGMEMHRRYEHRQIGAVFGKKCVQSRINLSLIHI